MRRPVVLVLAALVGIGAAGAAAAFRAFGAFVRYSTPFASVQRSDDAPPVVARPVVMVVVDGLRLDVARTLPFLAELRRRGTDLECEAGSPSFSLPARGVLMTGAWAEVHGQLLNFHPRPLRVEHLFESARRAGLRTGLLATADIHALFPGHVDVRRVHPRERVDKGGGLQTYAADVRATGDDALAVLAERPDLAVLEVPSPDVAAHAWGGTSAGYRTVAEETDRMLRRVASAVDLERGVLVVTADHGHTDAGGHGGDEPEVVRVPLVFAGRGIRAGAAGTARQIDVAATLAAILGVPIPRSSQGTILDVFDAEGAGGAAERARVLRAQRERAEQDVAAVLRSTPADRQALDRRARRLGALGIAAAPLLVLLLAGGAGHRGLLPPAVLGGAAGILLYAVLRAAFGVTTSLSALNRDEDLPRHLLFNAALAVAAVAAGMTIGRWASRRRTPAAGDRALVVALAVVVFLAVLLARIARAYGEAGFVMEWALVDMRTRYGLYQDALAVAAVGLLSPLLVWGVSAVRRRRSV